MISKYEFKKDILYKSNDIETYSSGIRRIYEERTENRVKVEFRKEKIRFTIIFYRKNYEKENEITKNVPVNVQLNITEESILKIIMKNPKVTQISIANQLKVSEKTVKRNISKLKEKGIVERIGADKNGNRF